MNQKEQKNIFTLYGRWVWMLLAVIVLAFASYAWLSANKKTSADNLDMKVKAEERVQIDSALTAVRTCLTGEVDTDTCVVDDDGSIYLTKRVKVNENAEDADGNKYTETSTETHDVSEKVPLEISSILPGEYIDITVGFYLPEDLDGATYTVSLGDFVSDSFVIDDKTHLSAGGFRYQPIRMVDENGNSLADYSAVTSQWFVTYDYETDDDQEDPIQVATGTWDNDYGKIYFTFRVQEDFKQYYELIGKAKEAYSNMLSRKSFVLGSIIFGWNE